jgi:hypothetical protein
MAQNFGSFVRRLLEEATKALFQPRKLEPVFGVNAFLGGGKKAGPASKCNAECPLCSGCCCRESGTCWDYGHLCGTCGHKWG